MSAQKLDFFKYKYGLFMHYVHGISMFSDGRKPGDINETVDSFDVEGYAEDVAATGAQFLIFTAWHWKTIPLYPSEVTAKWRGCETPRRDLIGEIIDALNAKGVKVIIYTHPRDGHDFDPAERVATGWGEGQRTVGGADSQANPLTFNNERWNAYITELYTELADRYAHKIYGFYTDGAGPHDGSDPSMENNFQIVNYLKIRDIMKSRNPEIVMIQNYFGYLFSDDFAMPEGYFGFETDVLKSCIEKLPAAEKSLAICPFDGNWLPAKPLDSTNDDSFPPIENMIKFVLFNASCTIGGGTVYATAPYCEGNVWEHGVIEYLKSVGNKVNQYKKSVFDAKVSKSYPTISGETLESLDYKFFMTSDDDKYEYLHIMKGTDTVTLENSLDGATLENPVSLTKGLKVESFDGKTLTLSGSFDEIDSVIRFDRINNENAPAFEWINDTDKRIRYSSKSWKYYHLSNVVERQKLFKGCFESDIHRARADGDTAFLAFEGSVVEIYARGKATVFIDGINVGQIDCSSESDGKRNLSYTSMNLHGGWHTLYMVVEKDFDFDAVRIVK